MSAPPPTILPVSLRQAFTALVDHRLIAMCAGDVAHHSARTDGALRGNFTHVDGDARMTYQLTIRVLEACSDSHRIRYQILAREERGGSLAALTLDAALSVVDKQTSLVVEPHLVLAGPHGGIPYTDLETASADAVQVLSTRIAGLLSDQSTLESLVPLSEVEVEVGAARDRTRFAPGRLIRTGHTREAVLATATAGLLSIAAYVILRRSRRNSRPSVFGHSEVL